jgi:hypothetical protein
LLRLHGHNLLLEQTSAAALDTVQLVIHLIGTIKGHIQDRACRDGIELDGRQPRVDDQLARLVARGHVAGQRGVQAGGLDGLDDIDDGGAAADAYPLGVLGVVVCDGDFGGGAFGFFDTHGGGGGREAGEGGEREGFVVLTKRERKRRKRNRRKSETRARTPEEEDHG